MTLALREVAGAVQFGVKVVPGASRTRVVGPFGDGLKLQVAAPPEGGKANAAVCELLATTLGVAVRAVQVVAGAGNPRKTVAVTGLSLATVAARLAAIAPPPAR